MDCIYCINAAVVAVVFLNCENLLMLKMNIIINKCTSPQGYFGVTLLLPAFGIPTKRRGNKAASHCVL